MTSMIGNIYVEIFNVSQSTKMWVFLLPVVDMIISSFMLYLQFDFTKVIYAKLCGQFDIYFIEFCGDLLDKDVNDQNVASSAKEKVLSTTNTTVAGGGGGGAQVPPTKMMQQASMQSLSVHDHRLSSVYCKPPTPFNKEENLTLDMAEIEEAGTFRAPSPSPSPIAETQREENVEDKKRKRPPPPPRPKLSNCSVSGMSNGNAGGAITPRSPTPVSPKNNGGGGRVDTSFW